MMKYMRFHFLTLFIFITFSVFSQNHLLDSLHTALKNHPQRDTTRLSIIFKICYEEYTFRPEENKILADEALKISRELNFSKGIGNAHGALALYYWATGDYEQATDHAYKMLRIHEHIPFLEGVGQSYQILAVIHQLEGDFNKSQFFFNKALEIFEKEKIKQDIALCYNMMGLCYASFSRLDQAHEYLLKSLEIWKETKNENWISLPYMNLGRVYLLKGKYREALEYFKKSLQIVLKQNNWYRIAINYTRIGEVYIYTHEYDSSEFYLFKSVALLKSINQKKKLEEAYIKLTLLEKKRGRPGTALQYSDLASAYRDSIFTESKANKISEIEARYETEKKDQIIQLLERDKQIHRLWSNILITTLVLVVLISGIVYQLQRYRERKNRQILDLEIDYLTSQHEEISKKYENVIMRENDSSVDSIDQRLLKKAMEVIENNMHDPMFGVDKMALELGMSRTNMHRKIKGITGFPPSEFIRSLRLRKAAMLLLKKASTVSEISFIVGFGDISHFSKSFKKQFKVPPSEYFRSRNQMDQH